MPWFEGDRQGVTWSCINKNSMHLVKSSWKGKCTKISTEEWGCLASRLTSNGHCLDYQDDQIRKETLD